jgi:hypothetical protein
LSKKIKIFTKKYLTHLKKNKKVLHVIQRRKKMNNRKIKMLKHVALGSFLFGSFPGAIISSMASAENEEIVIFASENDEQRNREEQERMRLLRLKEAADLYQRRIKNLTVSQAKYRLSHLLIAESLKKGETGWVAVIKVQAIEMLNQDLFNAEKNKTQLGALTEGQKAALQKITLRNGHTYLTVKDLDKKAIETLQRTPRQGLMLYQRMLLNDGQANDLLTEEMRNLRADQIVITNLSPQEIWALQPRQVAEFTQEQIAELTPEQIVAFRIRPDLMAALGQEQAAFVRQRYEAVLNRRPAAAPREPAAAPRLGPVAVPRLEPTTAPRLGPIVAPRLEPVAVPRLEPTTAPRLRPVAAPRLEPVAAPREPAAAPRLGPVAVPRLEPTTAPRLGPVAVPRLEPATAPREPAAAPNQAPAVVPGLDSTNLLIQTILALFTSSIPPHSV